MRGTRGGLLALVFGLARLACLRGRAQSQGHPRTVAYLDPIGAFSNPTYVTAPPDDATRLFVVEQGGTIQLFKNGTASLFMTVPGVTSGGERGLLSMAFPPDYAASGLFYVYYTRTGDGAIQIDEFHRDASNPDIGDPTSVRHVFDGPASGPVESQRRPAPSSGRTGCSTSGPATAAAETTRRTTPSACSPAREAASYRSEAIRPNAYTVPANNPFVGLAGACRNLVVRPPQPVAVLVRPRHAATSTSATSARTSGRRSTTGRSTSAAVAPSTSAGAAAKDAIPRRASLQPASSEHGRSRLGIHALGRAQRLLDLGRLRRPRPGGSRPPRPLLYSDYCNGAIYSNVLAIPDAHWATWTRA